MPRKRKGPSFKKRIRNPGHVQTARNQVHGPTIVENGNTYVLNEINDPKLVLMPDGRIGRKIGLDEEVDLRQGGEFFIAKKNPDGSLRYPASTPLDEILTDLNLIKDKNHVLGDRTSKRQQFVSNDPLDVEIERLVRQKKLLHQHHICRLLKCGMEAYGLGEKSVGMYSLVSLIVSGGEWFHFETMANHFIASEAKRLMHVMGTGLIHLPYECCCFTHGYLDEEGIYCQCVYLVAEGHANNPANGLRPGHFAVIEFRISLHNNAIRFDPRIGVITTFQLVSGNPTHRYQELLSNPLGLTGWDLQCEMASAIDPVSVMMMAINTKNLRMDRVEPAPALNKARAKQGKAPLRHYTRVYMHEYINAAHETNRLATSKGTHASPRPHLRRAHMRYRDHPTVKPKWIEAVIVNAHKGPPIQRDGYMVKE